MTVFGFLVLVVVLALAFLLGEACGFARGVRHEAKRHLLMVDLRAYDPGHAEETAAKQ